MVVLYFYFYLDYKHWNDSIFYSHLDLSWLYYRVLTTDQFIQVIEHLASKAGKSPEDICKTIATNNPKLHGATVRSSNIFIWRNFHSILNTICFRKLPGMVQLNDWRILQNILGHTKNALTNPARAKEKRDANIFMTTMAMLTATRKKALTTRSIDRMCNLGKTDYIFVWLSISSIFGSVQ